VVLVIVITLAYAAALASWATARRRIRRVAATATRPAAAVTEVADPAAESIDPEDAADLDARFEQVDGEVSAHRNALFRARVQPLLARRVPVRAIEPVPSLHTVRVRFADGTVLGVRGITPGDVGVLASVVRDHAVCLASCSTDATGTNLVFGWSAGRHTMAVRITGLDQPE
jgi:hypothetical protein